MLRRSFKELPATLLVLLWSYALLSKLFHFRLFVLQLHGQPVLHSFAIPLAFVIV